LDSLFFGALAAFLDAVLELVLEVSNRLEESGHGLNINTGWEFDHAGFNVLALTFAAFLFVLDVTSGFRALELTLGTRASGGLSTRPRARGLFTERSTVGLGSDTSGVTLGGSANSLTLGARFLLAHVLGATNGAFGLFTVDSAFGTLSLLTLHFAFGSCTHWVANSGTRGVVALPATSGVTVGTTLLLAFSIDFGFGFRLGFCGESGDHQHAKH